MNKTKAQIKMFESIAILIVFFILILFGFMFYTALQKSEIQRGADESATLKAIDTAQVISFSAELQCSQKNDQDEDCIDLLKLDSAKNIIDNNREDYFPMFGFTDIYVEEIYPNNNSYSFYDFPKEKYNRKISTQFPKLLYNPITDSYSFGILYVDNYI